MQTFLAVHIALMDHYVMNSEWDLNKGYAVQDLEPRPERSPDMAYGYVLEIKYLRRGRGQARTRWPPWLRRGPHGYELA